MAISRLGCADAVEDRVDAHRSKLGAGFATIWLVLASQHGGAAAPNAGPMADPSKEAPGSAQAQLHIAAARPDTDGEIALNAALQRQLALTLERLSRRKQELRWTVTIIALAGLVVALLSWMLVTNLRYRRELLRLAEEDSLTGLPNRRRTAEQATAALISAANGHRPVTIALIDLDHFKSINDRCGHAAGDRVLKEFARLTREVLRASDTLGRWGGEEFLLILPDTEIGTAVAILSRMRTAIADIPLPETFGSCVSFSAGVATRTSIVQSLDEVIASADAALYEAKSAGRNRLRLDNETYRAAASGVLGALYDRPPGETETFDEAKPAGRAPDRFAGPPRPPQLLTQTSRLLTSERDIGNKRTGLPVNSMKSNLLESCA